MIKVLMLSTDGKVLEEGSEAWKRMVLYGEIFDELRVVVFNTKLKSKDLGVKNTDTPRNVFIHPTNSWNKLLCFWNAYVIGKRILKENPRMILTSQDGVTNFVALLLKAQYKISLQVQIHTDFTSPFFRKESLKNLLYYMGYRLGIRYADCVRVVSARIKNSILVTGDQLPVATTPIFVDIRKISGTPITDDLRKKYSQFDFIILMASRLTREKNIALALRAYKKVVTKYPKTGLCIVGEGPEQTELKSQVTNFKLQKNVVFEQWVPYEILVSYYKTADLFLLTSNYEGYGRTLIEAAVSLCPIITTDVGLVGDVLKPGRDVVACPVGDEKCFRDEIARLIGDQAVRSSLAQNAKNVAEVAAISVEEYLKQYKSALETCSK